MRFEFDGHTLDDQLLTLTGGDGPVHLEPQVFRVLHHLLLNRDRVVSKEELLDQIWGDRFVSESALTSRVKALRRAIGDTGRSQRLIRTVHGRGYQFVAEVRMVAGGDRRQLALLRSEPIGREVDIGAVVTRVRDAPLVTIVGPGGVGKTTLALAVAHTVQSEFADGAVFVDLAPVLPGEDLTRAVADATGVEGDASRSIADLADHLASRPVLLVLDNCEHVLGRAAQLVARILERGQAAHVLATSRESLHLPAEHLWPLGPLGDAGPALFVERARAAEPRTRWDATDPRVIALCHQLDNVPLALELAAGQLRRFELDELVRRLDTRLTLLSRGGTDSSHRHVTMESAIDWSYQLLAPVEQELFRHLSVFPASFDLAAVEGSAPPSVQHDTDAVFGELVDKSLVVREPSTGRYRLLETIRAFARDHLREAGEDPAAIERHWRHVHRRVAATSRLDRWLSARLAAGYRAELENVRQALRFCVDDGHVIEAVDIAVGAAFLWRNAIGCTEGDQWVHELLRLGLSDHDRLWVELLRADVGQGRGDHRQMFDAGECAQRLAAGADDVAAACLAAHYGALAHLTDEDHAKGRLSVALDLAERSGDARLVTLIQAFVAVADVAAGAYDEARALVESLDEGASEDGYDGFIVHWAGWLRGLAEKDAVSARRWFGRQEDFLHRTGIVETWLTTFSSAMCDLVDGGDVRDLLAHALSLADREGYQAGADCLLALAYGELCAGRFDTAAELTGTAIQSGFNATAHYVLYRAVIDRALRLHLDASALEEAMERGRRRPAAEVLSDYGIMRA